MDTDLKSLRSEEYQKAEDYVRSVYQASPPPYSESQLLSVLAEVEGLAPRVSLDRGWLERLILRLSKQSPELHAVERSDREWSALFPRYPETSDGFVKSLQPHEHEAIRQTLDTYGLVVVQAFSPEVCSATIDAMFEEVNAQVAALGKDTPAVHPEQSWTWDDRNWPVQSKFLLRQPAFHPQAFANRVASNVYDVFAMLWQEDRLRVTIDNWGIARGSKNLLLPNEQGELVPTEKRRWGKGIKPHWDYNPWLWVDEVEQGRNPGYQAVVALNEHHSGMGCHLTLPGGAPFLAQWCREHACPSGLGKKRRSHRPEEDDPIRQYMQEIPLRQGEMLIWSWGQLHATAHNDSDRMRLHQYIRVFPARESDPFYEEHDRYAPQRVMRQYSDVVDFNGLDLNKRGRRLLGLEEWPI